MWPEDLLCSNVTMSHFVEFRPLFGTVASIANVISLMVATQPAGSLKASLLGVCYSQLCCGDSPQTLGPMDESPSQHPPGRDNVFAGSWGQVWGPEGIADVGEYLSTSLAFVQEP